MTIRKSKKSFIVRGALMCAGLFLALFCATAPRTAQALVEAKAPSTLQKGATYVGMDTCLTCHEEQGRTFKLSPHARLVQKGTENEAQGCETCHGPGSIHAENGGGKGNAIINPKKDPTICFTCHMEKKMEFRLPNHHPVLEGKMSCTDCHEVHSSDTRPSAASMEGPNETCFKCHKDQQGPFVYDHPAMSEGCTTCHKVHGSINQKMLTVRDTNLCLKCHESAGFPQLGSSSHAGRTGRGACWSCHKKVHGSNFHKALEY
ncbi:MAG: hypothetical protein HQL22_01520 [Candidatus Omnitrophica bacterium]|nr:hypothetical protein [Candidatus Omnitrophota bacterium]